jgi:hypothetical protein
LLRVNERTRDAHCECATARAVAEIPCNQRDFAKMQHVNNFSPPERDSALQNASLGKKRANRHPTDSPSSRSSDASSVALEHFHHQDRGALVGFDVALA